MDFKKFADLIMIEQTTFALPFAYIGILFAGGGSLSQWLWATVALVAARTAGMSFNRVLDAGIDAENPRTADRLIPRGEVSRFSVWSMGIGFSVMLIFAAYMLNTLVFHLSFAAVAMLFSYSLFKRFSSTSHFYLGMVEAAAPIGGYLAVTGSFEMLAFLPGAAIFFWIAGVDILYAVQDIEFDKSRGLHSIPVRIGKERSLTLSAFCYTLSIAALIFAGYAGDMTSLYWISLIAVAGIFLRQQGLAQRDSTPYEDRIKQVFAINRFVSPAIFIGTLADVLARLYL